MVRQDKLKEFLNRSIRFVNDNQEQIGDADKREVKLLVQSIANKAGINIEELLPLKRDFEVGEFGIRQFESLNVILKNVENYNPEQLEQLYQDHISAYRKYENEYDADFKRKLSLLLDQLEIEKTARGIYEQLLKVNVNLKKHKYYDHKELEEFYKNIENNSRIQKSKIWYKIRPLIGEVLDYLNKKKNEKQNKTWYQFWK